MKDALEAIAKGDARRLAAALESDPCLAAKPRLMLAAAGGARLDALKLLVRRGADPNALWRNYRPLHALIQEEAHGGARPTAARRRGLEWLLAHGADPERLGAWPSARAIVVAAFSGVRDYVTILREGGARVDAFAACALGEAAAVKREIRRRPGLVAERDGGVLTALQCCAGSRLGRGDRTLERRIVEIAGALLDAGAEPGARTKSWGHEITAIDLAVGAGNGSMLELLLERGGSADDALAAAAWRETDDLARIALDHGASVERARTGDGRPLLNEMIRWGRVSWASWLLERGADPNVADERGWTAVHQAASRGNARMLDAVLAAGGDPGGKDREGRSPRDVAAAKIVLRIAKAVAASRSR